MLGKDFFWLIAFGFFLVVIAACSTAQLSEVVLATQVDEKGAPLNQATSFTIDTPRILCSVKLKEPHASSDIRARWFYNESGGWRLLQEEAFTAQKSTYLVFSLNEPSGGWQRGDYACRLYLNDREQITRQFSIQTREGVAPPVINSFAATPTTVSQGQPLTLSWNVSGASRIALEPELGSVNAGGSILVTPKGDATYTIKAINSGGSASSTVQVKVLPPQIDKPDLIVVDVFREATMVYYRIKNEGTATSRPCNATLYVNGIARTTDYIAPLAPGEQRTEIFGQFTWTFIPLTPATVCVDSDNQNDESNEENNCLTRFLPGVGAL